MSIRETINKNPVIANTIVGVIILGVAVFLYYYFTYDPQAVPTEAYYTVDDGETLFVDDAQRIVPFEHDGGEAVRALVYECDGEQFVNHLLRYNPDAHDTIRKQYEENPDVEVPEAAYNSRQIRRPGEAEWHGVISGPGIDILSVKCPHGNSDSYPKPVFP